MARPQSNDLTLREHPGRPRPWGVHWRETTRAGERTKRAKFFSTPAEAEAFIAAVTEAAATIPERPPTLGTPTAAASAIAAVIGQAPRGSLTFRAFADDWLETVVARRKPSTQRSYAGVLDTHVYPTLGRVRVSPETLGPEQVVAVIAARTEAGVSWGTQKAVLRVLSSCLRWAVKYRHLTTNPAAGLMRDLKDDSDPAYADPEPNPLTAAQADAFLSWLLTGQVPGAPPDRPVDGPLGRGGRVLVGRAGFPEWHPYFLTLLRTGMRRGEAAGLRWDTVYLEPARRRPYARLEASYSPSAKGDGTLKSKRGREVDLADALVDVLRGLARTRRSDAFARGKGTPSAYVFVTPRGARMVSDSKTAERIFARGMAAIGLAPAGHTIHDLRDTFATCHLLQDPARLFWVSAMLGHRQTSTTLNRYTKWVPQLAGAAFASALDRPAAAPGAQEAE